MLYLAVGFNANSSSLYMRVKFLFMCQTKQAEKNEDYYPKILLKKKKSNQISG